jgi:hypothetical protein
MMYLILHVSLWLQMQQQICWCVFKDIYIFYCKPITIMFSNVFFIFLSVCCSVCVRKGNRPQKARVGDKFSTSQLVINESGSRLTGSWTSSSGNNICPGEIVTNSPIKLLCPSYCGCIYIVKFCIVVRKSGSYEEWSYDTMSN